MQHPEHPVRQPGAGQQPGNGIGAARHVGRMLEQGHIAGHQRRGEETEHLPEREIPRHHRQHAAQRLMPHIAAAGLGGDRLIGQHRLGVVGVVLADAGAFVDLGHAFALQLAHFRPHQCRQFRCLRAQGLRRPAQHASALLPGRTGPAGKRGGRTGDALLQLCRVMQTLLMFHLPGVGVGRGVHCLQAPGVHAGHCRPAGRHGCSRRLSRCPSAPAASHARGVFHCVPSATSQPPRSAIPPAP